MSNSDLNSFENTPLPVEEAVASMVMPGVGIQASNFENFKDDVFGRDSIRFGRDLPDRQDIGRLVIDSLARLQAREEQVANEMADATFGGIHHEARLLYVDGRKIGPKQQEHLQRWSKRFGGDDNGFIYYGATDATPDYVTFVAEYCQRFGMEWLDETFEHVSGREYTYKQSLLDAITWIEERLEVSDIGLVESFHQNPTGHYFQFWRDTHESYRDPEGKIINALGPIASFEVQIKAYDALMNAADLLGDEMQDKVEEWRDRAADLRRRTLEWFWMPEDDYFGMAVDRDVEGKPRLVKTISSLPAESLDSRFWGDLDEADRQKYVAAIVQRTFTDEFLTEVGIRCLSKSLFAVLSHHFNHGPSAVWPMSNNVISIGLSRQGFYVLADELDQRTLNSVNIAGKLLENYDVTEDGRINYDPTADKEIEVDREELISSILPEHTQAWTASAIARILATRQQGLAKEESWQKALTEEILGTITPAPRYSTQTELDEAFPRQYGFVANRERALEEMNKDLVAAGYPTIP